MEPFFMMVSFPTLYSNLSWGRCLNHIGTEGFCGCVTWDAHACGIECMVYDSARIVDPFSVRVSAVRQRPRLGFEVDEYSNSRRRDGKMH